ncbi:DUF2058 domain-containing protein [Marinobacter sp. 1Y8]
MAKSLQEQLLQAGLSDEKKAKQVKQEKHKARKQKRPVDAEVEVQRLAAEKARADKVARDREMNQQRLAEQRHQERRAQVKQMVEQHGISRGHGETPYQFVVDKKVHKIYVNAEQGEHLSRGRLAIVVLGEDNFHVVPGKVADKIRQRETDIPVIQHEPSSQEVDEDDPYADYQIPDDLMW